VILYELLTGLRPFDSQRLRKAALDEVVRILREEEPPRPSTRLSTNESLPSLAALRQTEPKRLMALMRGELDWVVMKCLEKDRNRRYETANGLVRDVQRYLADEAVEARPPSAGYRVRKFLRRHKGPVLAAAAMVVLLVVGATVSTWQAVRATRAEGVAEERRESAEAAEREAKDERDVAEKERQRAETNEAKAQRSLYIANMNRVRFELEHNNIEPARKLLDLYRQPETPEKDPRGWEWFYWDRMCKGELHTLKGHQGQVLAVAFSPDGSLLASAGGSPNPTIKVWDTVTGKELRTLTGFTAAVSMIVFSPDGRMLASRSSTAVTLWQVTTGKEIRTLTLEGKGTIGPVAFSPDWKTLAVGVSEGASKSIKFWDLGEQKWHGSLPANTDTHRLQYSPDGKRLALASSDGAQLWDVARRTLLHVFTGHSFTNHFSLTLVSEAITALAFSPDGRILATCSQDGTAMLHDVRSGKHIRTLTALPAGYGGASGLFDLAFSPDGNSLITAGQYGSLKLWDVSTGREELSFLGDSNRVLCVAISPDGTRLASGSTAGEIKIWDALAGPTQSLSSDRIIYPRFHAFSPNGKMMAREYGRRVEVWHLGQARPALLLDHAPAYADAITFSPDSKILASACSLYDRESRQTTSEIRLWNLESGQVVRSFAGFKDSISLLVFSPDGKTLALKTETVEGDRRKRQEAINLWDLETGKEQQSFPGSCVAFTSDGQTLAVVGDDRTLKLIDRNHGRELLHLKSQGTGKFVTLSRDGSRLFFDSTVWETATGQPICGLAGIEASANAYFSPDGKRLFSVIPASANRGLLGIWDTTMGDLLLEVPVPGRRLVVHPDGWRCDVSSTGRGGTWLVDAQPLTPELRQQREAHNLVAQLFRKPMLKEDVLAFLRGLKTISESVRQEALVLAQQQEQDAELLNVRSGMILIHADRTPVEYRQALKWAEEAQRLRPRFGPFVNTFGVALYRVGRYEEAVAALERSRELNLKASQVDHYAYDLLFLAMAQWQLGRHDEAKASLQRARDHESHPGHVEPRHWREAEALIEGKPNEPDK
jgi:WD40 repeat protein